MQIKELKVFICDHCGKKMFGKGAMVRHEKWCYSNPVNYEACRGCEHCQVGTKVIHADSDDSDKPDYRKEVTTFFCKKLNQEMYPVKAARKGLPERYPDTFKNQVRMPATCEHFAGGNELYMKLLF